MLPRHHWQQHVATLDPETDYEEIYRIVIAHEFPWDLHQAMSFALFRTYAVPSIGRLLDDTGEFHRAPQKRYDDTVLLLDEPARAGLHSGSGRRAIRRINQMHGAYDIANQDMRYVLSTFVVVPKRWLDDFGWRALSPVEVRASVCYYRELGRLMGIRDLPATYAGFEELLTSYEAEHFAYDEGGRRVADATMHLLTTFYPAGLARLVHVASLALLDDPLLAAFRYTRPPAPCAGWSGPPSGPGEGSWPCCQPVVGLGTRRTCRPSGPTPTGTTSTHSAPSPAAAPSRGRHRTRVRTREAPGSRSRTHSPVRSVRDHRAGG
jgi:hypothetical protein